MILPDDKRLPPPPYRAAMAIDSRSARGRGGPRLSDLPQSLLLQIVEATFAPHLVVEGLEAHRRNLHWLMVSLRLVNRGLYFACMHRLRSTFVETYLSLVRRPYTSDPFPLGQPEASSPTESTISHSIRSLQRETEVLDLFIALKTREDVFRDDTDLHLEREDGFNDLFALMQPWRRTEDLLRLYGVRYGYITLSDSPASHPHRSAIPISQLSISFSARKVAVALLTPCSNPASRHTPQKRTIILECGREKDEKLEVVAKRLAIALGRWIADRR